MMMVASVMKIFMNFSSRCYKTDHGVQAAGRWRSCAKASFGLPLLGGRHSRRWSCKVDAAAASDSTTAAPDPLDDIAAAVASGFKHNFDGLKLVRKVRWILWAATTLLLSVFSYSIMLITHPLAIAFEEGVPVIPTGNNLPRVMPKMLQSIWRSGAMKLVVHPP